MNSPNTPVKQPRAPLLLLLGALIAMLVLAAHAAPAAPGSSDSSGAGPTITVVGGDNQTGAPGAFNAQPFDVAVWNASGTAPLVGVDVTFSVEAGGGVLASAREPSLPPAAATLTLKTDRDGTAQAYYLQPLAAGIVSRIKVAAESDQLTLLTRSLTADDSADGATSATHDSASNGTERANVSGNTTAEAGLPGQTLADGASAGTNSPRANAPARNARTHPVQLMIRTPKGFFAIDTSTWAITASAQ